MNWPLRRRLTLTYVVTGVVLAVVVTLTSLSLVRLDRAIVRNSDRLSPARTIESRYFAALLDQETGVRGYALTGDTSFLQPYQLGLMQEGMRTTVVAHAEITKEELDVEKGVKRALGDKGRLHLVWGNTLYEKDELPLQPDMSDLSDVFTPFRNKVPPLVSLLA